MSQGLEKSADNFPIIDFNSLGLVNPAEQLIQNTVLKFADHVWSAKGDTFPHGTKMLAFFTAHAAQFFEDNGPVMAETIVKMHRDELPDIEELNKAIPKEAWPHNYDGSERAEPWRHQYVVYLENPATASLYTYLNSTVGAKVAVSELEGRLRRMSAQCGKNLGAIIELREQVISKRRSKSGPNFSIVNNGWFELVNTPVWLPKVALPRIGRDPIHQIEHSTRKSAKSKQVKPISSDDDFDDPLD